MKADKHTYFWRTKIISRVDWTGGVGSRANANAKARRKWRNKQTISKSIILTAAAKVLSTLQENKTCVNAQ